MLIGGLTERGQSDDDVAGADTRIVDHIGAAHAAGDGAIDNDRAYQIAHVGRLATCGVHTDTHLTQLGQQLVCTVDNGRDHFTRDQQFVAPDGT